MQPDRLMRIRQALYLQGNLGIHALARELGFSIATIRRDLTRLAARESHALTAKCAIGSRAFERIRPHSTIFLDAGTTVLQLARGRRLTPLSITVFTSSLAVADTLFGAENIQVYVLGGRLRHENKCVVGPRAERSIDGLWFAQLFLGANTIQLNDTVATPDGEEAALNALMLQHAGERILLVEHSELGRHATRRVAPLTALPEIISDSAVPLPP